MVVVLFPLVPVIPIIFFLSISKINSNWEVILSQFLLLSNIFMLAKIYSKYDKKIKHIYNFKQDDYKICLFEINNFVENVDKGLKTSDDYYKIPTNSKLE